MAMNTGKRHHPYTCRAIAASILIASLTMFLMLSAAQSSADVTESESPVIYNSETAGFSVTLPASVTLKNESSGRVVWNYDAGDDLTITIRLNYIYIGVNMDPDEYLKILFDCKKNEGIEPQWKDIKGGRAFTYEVRSGKTDEDLINYYLIAISGKGWLCTTTVMGKGSAMKKEPGLFKDVFDSFEYRKAQAR